MKMVECDCSVADLCPQRRVGSAARCAILLKETRSPMTRKDAFSAILHSRLAHNLMSDSLAVDHKTANLIIDALEALGLLKFDEKPDTGAEDVLRNLVIRTSRFAPPDTGWMIGDYGAERIVATLRGAGYRVEKA